MNVMNLFMSFQLFTAIASYLSRELRRAQGRVVT